MLDIPYNPEDVGKEVMTSHGKIARIRKYHMTEGEKKLALKRWKEEIIGIDKRIVKRAGPIFFNPYRKGIYHYQISSLFSLGANKWHSLSSIIEKLEEIMSLVAIKKDSGTITAWEKFKGRSNRESATRCKDFIGRIQENMTFFQRLNKLNPTGYKLRQVCSAVDMKRVSKAEFPNGCFYYRLSTYSTEGESYPIRDYSKFTFIRHKSKYTNYKFLGTIITKEDKKNEMSQV